MHPFEGEDRLRMLVPCFCNAAVVGTVLAFHCEVGCHASVQEAAEEADHLAALGALEALDNMKPLSAFAALGAKTVSDVIIASGAKAVPGGMAAAAGVTAAPGAGNVPGGTVVVGATGPPVAATGLDVMADATAVTDATGLTGAALVLDEVTHLVGKVELGVALASAQVPQLCTAVVLPYDSATSVHPRRASSDSTQVKSVTKVGASAA